MVDGEKGTNVVYGYNDRRSVVSPKVSVLLHFLPCTAGEVHATCTKSYDFVDKVAYYTATKNCRLLVTNTQATDCIFILKRNHKHGSLRTHGERERFDCLKSAGVSRDTRRVQGRFVYS